MNTTLWSGRPAARRLVDELKMRQVRQQRQLQKDRRTERAVSSDTWKETIRSITPVNFSELDVKEIRKLLAVYLAALPASPHEEAQIWLTSLISTASNSLSAAHLQRPVEFGLHTEIG